jgi:hypothetical protein
MANPTFDFPRLTDFPTVQPSIPGLVMAGVLLPHHLDAPITSRGRAQ